MGLPLWSCCSTSIRFINICSSSAMRRRLAERDRLFQLISENAADMIAVVDKDGRRLYNSPAYEKILGYSQDELVATSPLEQIHPDDRVRVLGAAEKARPDGLRRAA